MFSFLRPFVIGDSTWQKTCEEDYCKPMLDMSPSDPWFSMTCYRQMSMAAFAKINASWITYNTLCDSQKWGLKLSDSKHVDNLQEAYLEVSSYKLCPYGM